MFPLYDENPRLRFPHVTVAIIALNALSWLWLQGLGGQRALAQSLCLFGLIPADLLGQLEPGTSIPFGSRLACVVGQGTPWHTPITSMFMHGGWFHIIGNLWFLWVFGDNVEDAMGRWRFIVFYLLCGFAAAAAQIASDPSSALPMVGASGAIGGVMGAYGRLYPRVYVHNFIFIGFYATTIAIPAYLMLGYWFVLQLVGGLPALGGSEGGGVAFWAHIGGFVAGYLLVGLFARRDYVEASHARRTTRSARHRWP